MGADEIRLISRLQNLDSALARTPPDYIRMLRIAMRWVLCELCASLVGGPAE